MADKELATFRERWKQELSHKKEQHFHGRAPSTSSSSGDVPHESSRGDAPKNQHLTCSEDNAVSGRKERGEAADTEDQPEYVSIARSLLDGRTSPLLERIQEERTRRKRQYHNMTDACRASLQQEKQPKGRREEELVEQLIEDLNEVNDIPFFDVELPYELALKIFQYLTCAVLGRCAQVSRAWRVLAEDGVLWFRMCTREGYHPHASVSDSPCWKSTLRDCRSSAKAVRSNWKNRVGSISQLQFELGKVLCDVSSCDNYVLAG
ncbi:F-box/WD repeat-containing protein 8 [Oryzias melastigma]|uniref:F-box/WD repeat-containing protein 8 n=1 Tax=Oryzias melastigma TaxID=30732 RepID=A0A834FQD5_ORYME|nr:F-box/WD repeat-containing protein 8 [Oryzias melastigma]